VLLLIDGHPVTSQMLKADITELWCMRGIVHVAASIEQLINVGTDERLQASGLASSNVQVF
jgi:hypothetical protein